MADVLCWGEKAGEELSEHVHVVWRGAVGAAEQRGLWTTGRGFIQNITFSTRVIRRWGFHMEFHLEKGIYTPKNGIQY